MTKKEAIKHLEELKQHTDIVFLLEEHFINLRVEVYADEKNRLLHIFQCNTINEAIERVNSLQKWDDEKYGLFIFVDGLEGCLTIDDFLPMPSIKKETAKECDDFIPIYPPYSTSHNSRIVGISKDKKYVISETFSTTTGETISKTTIPMPCFSDFIQESILDRIPKTYKVRVYYNSYADVEIDAHNEEEALQNATEFIKNELDEEVFSTQILENLSEAGGECDCEEITK